MEALRSKIQEGHTKKIPPARVLRVLERFVSHMQDARKDVKRGRRPVPPRLLVAMAEARLAGLTRKTILLVVRPGGSIQDVRRVDALVTLHLKSYSGAVAVRLVKAASAATLPRLPLPGAAPWSRR